MTKDVDLAAVGPAKEALAKFLTQERHRVHLIGVAGSGMSGIAGLLLQLGHQVSGSDKLDTLETDRLQRLGLKFYQQHRAEDARDAELIIYSSAIRPENPILKSARENGKRTARRAEALAAIMSAKRGVLIVGMHGKTTTSAMTAHVLREGGLHPSHYVGAEIPILGTNSHWDARGEYFVAEGDESDGTIALFHPEHTLVLNIEEEHLDFLRRPGRHRESLSPTDQPDQRQGFLLRRRRKREPHMSILRAGDLLRVVRKRGLSRD